MNITFVSMVNRLHNSPWITFPTQSCLVLYSVCSILLQTLVMEIFLLFILSLDNWALQFFFVFFFFCFLDFSSLFLCLSLSSFSWYNCYRQLYSVFFFFCFCISLSCYYLRFLHNNISRWSFSRVWMAASLPKSPGLF